nr:MAG TPA: hypothetical protein [Caudoviricetes sp.]
MLRNIISFHFSKDRLFHRISLNTRYIPFLHISRNLSYYYRILYL